MRWWLVGALMFSACAAKDAGWGDDGDGDADAADSSTGDEESAEPCEDVGDVRECVVDGYSERLGTEHCGPTDEYGLPPKMWSACAEHHTCLPGDSAECGWPDGSTYEVECLVDSYGALTLWCEPTPLAIDLGGDGFAFEPVGARAFDIAGDASCLDVDWPTRSTAWLAIDRDGDGAIADGTELFGSGTPMPDRNHASNGFVALATLDANRDSTITTRDPEFSRLVLWTDTDDDRRGTGDELLSLAQVGITSLPLAYDRARECDARGNCVVERASVTTHDGTRPLVDLHLACQ